MRTLRKRKACERTIVVPVRLRLRLSKGQDDWYVVTCKDLRGLVTQGKTVREAVANGREAAQLVIEVVLDEYAKSASKHR